MSRDVNSLGRLLRSQPSSGMRRNQIQQGHPRRTPLACSGKLRHGSWYRSSTCSAQAYFQRDHSKNRSCSLLGSTLWPGRPIDVSVCGAMHRKEGTESRGEIKQSSLGWRQDAAGHKRVSLELERSGKLCGRKAANMPYIKHLHSYSHQRPQSRQQNDQGHGSSATVLNKPDYERHGKRTSKDSR